MGQAYRYVGAKGINRNITFNYLQRDVPAGYEFGLDVYFSADEGKTWRPLKADVNAADNLAVATDMPGSGLYVLAASVDVPLAGKGWQLVSYPIPGTRPVAEALESIRDAGPTVYAYDSTDTENPWRVYDAAAPEASDLQQLEFGRGYWIRVTRPVTIQFAIPALAAAPAPLQGNAPEISLLTPPATFYGTIAAPPGGTVPQDAVVVAKVSGLECGRGRTKPDGKGGISYVVKVAAATASQPSCGAPGRRVVLETASGRRVGHRDLE